MKDIFPLTIVKDRYNGAYSKAKYLAFNLYADNDIFVEFIGCDDTAEMDFWYNNYHKNFNIGKGNTPQEAYDDLVRIINKLTPASQDKEYYEKRNF